ncbi:MAG: hypothetical protein BWX81_00550 [Spirochaetes bacterium ADurb.Bin110]|jgi:hypothetical protein|nr:MAG: hypothetical protein BWX81_00550 [Spirochaetes bacterium ADurb.Bin110]
MKNRRRPWLSRLAKENKEVDKYIRFLAIAKIESWTEAEQLGMYIDDRYPYFRYPKRKVLESIRRLKRIEKDSNMLEALDSLWRDAGGDDA